MAFQGYEFSKRRTDKYDKLSCSILTFLELMPGSKKIQKKKKEKPENSQSSQKKRYENFESSEKELILQDIFQEAMDLFEFDVALESFELADLSSFVDKNNLDVSDFNSIIFDIIPAHVSIHFYKIVIQDRMSHFIQQQNNIANGGKELEIGL